MSLHNVQLFNQGVFEDYHIFSRGKYIGRMTQQLYDTIMRSGSTEYNNAFIYDTKAKAGEKSWWRADGTPYPKEQVPKDYLVMCLLVT